MWPGVLRRRLAGSGGQESVTESVVTCSMQSEQIWGLGFSRSQEGSGNRLQNRHPGIIP